MTVHPNGTDARDIALHFVKVTDGRATPTIMKKTVSQAKSLLSHGYTKEEVIKVIDKCSDKGIKMYSIGYVSACINDVLREIKQEEEKEKAREVKKQIETHQHAKQGEVKVDDEQRRRNQEKARKQQSSVQSRFGKKFNFDMFEK